jgi:hypothetical protein
VAGDNETWDGLEGQIWDLVNHYEPQNEHIWQQSIDNVFDEHDEANHLVELQKLVTQLRSFHEPPPRRIVKPQSEYVSPPKQVHPAFGGFGALSAPAATVFGGGLGAAVASAVPFGFGAPPAAPAGGGEAGGFSMGASGAKKAVGGRKILKARRPGAK